MNRLFCSFFFISLIFAAGCKSPAVKHEDGTELSRKSAIIVNSFFKSIKSGDYIKGLNQLLGGNDIIDMKDSGTILMQNKFRFLNEASGKFVSEKLLRKRNLGNDVAVYIYFVKYDKKFYRFTFTFYNNDSVVKIYKFSFDDTIDTEMVESLRLYLDQQ